MLRKLQFSDYPLLADWISMDATHYGEFLPEFWYERDRISLVVEDENIPTMIVKLAPEPQTSMRMFIQFSPDQKRVAKAMLRNFDEVKSLIAKTGAQKIVFDTLNPDLAAFCQHAFKFVPAEQENNYQLYLEKPNASINTTKTE